MEIIQRMKRDKKFRVKAVFISALIFMFLVSGFGEKKEAEPRKTFEECHEFNSLFSTLATPTGLVPWSFPGEGTFFERMDFLKSNQERCEIAGCYVARYKSFAKDHVVCVPYVPEGWETVKIGLEADAEEACETGCFTAISETKVVCRDCKEGEEASICNAAERNVAKVVQGMGIDLTCKSAYYVTIFGGAFLILIIFAMI